jgi:hypothetical protein
MKRCMDVVAWCLASVGVLLLAGSVVLGSRLSGLQDR